MNTKQTRIGLSVFIAIMGISFGGAYWMQSTYQESAYASVMPPKEIQSSQKNIWNSSPKVKVRKWNKKSDQKKSYPQKIRPGDRINLRGK